MAKLNDAYRSETVALSDKILAYAALDLYDPERPKVGRLGGWIGWLVVVGRVVPWLLVVVVAGAGASAGAGSLCWWLLSWEECLVALLLPPRLFQGLAGQLRLRLNPRLHRRLPLNPSLLPNRSSRRSRPTPRCG